MSWGTFFLGQINYRFEILTEKHQSSGLALNFPHDRRQGNPKQGSSRCVSGEPLESVVLGFGWAESLLNFLGASMIVKIHKRLLEKPFKLSKEVLKESHHKWELRKGIQSIWGVRVSQKMVVWQRLVSDLGSNWSESVNQSSCWNSKFGMYETILRTCYGRLLLEHTGLNELVLKQLKL